MRSTNVLLLLILVMFMAAPVAAAQTTEVQVICYASDGTTVANQTTVNVSWMESNLPVFGDGATPYLLQGPMLNITNYSDPAKWNPAEDTSIDKVNETIRGTRLIDLCNLVGGMQPGDEVRTIASDNFTKTFPYENVYNPQPRQGPIVLAWWTARQGYSYSDGIRLFFGADTSTNPWGLHVFGNQDMKETFDEKYWSWFGGKDALPNAAQLSNKWIAKIEIVPVSSTNGTGSARDTATSTPTVTSTVTPAPQQTSGTEPVVLFDGNLTLTDGTYPCYAYNSGATHQVQNLTPQGFLELASKAGHFTYDVTDKKWDDPAYGTFLLDDAGGFNYSGSTDPKLAWAYRVNGVWKNDFSGNEGISVYQVDDGDLVEFYYGVKDGAFKDAEAVIRGHVSIPGAAGNQTSHGTTGGTTTRSINRTVAPTTPVDAGVTRTLSSTSIRGGEDLSVTLSIRGIQAGGVVETIPEGFTFAKTDYPTDRYRVSGQKVLFSVINTSTITYDVQARTGSSWTFTGTWNNAVDMTDGVIPDSQVAVGSTSGENGGGRAAPAQTTSTPGFDLLPAFAGLGAVGGAGVVRHRGDKKTATERDE
ncbi:hypothetical protein [Methanosphaerula palustris]|uniref:DUF4430 domain-containing protein n=1 Tax=Methanosphaerula palustris (strain ATCC BAA-1556 / DSM 19958 / E1-9c) TaxID=521011 RepID=B8GG25_METPE|nr:hypothetical protein [Methanosphaerula palustris]ACL16099.1 hypothetical protein Mpal_0735 [Methanosphaerula palustris E1-9c]